MSEIHKTTTPQGKLVWVMVSGLGKPNYNEDGYEYVASIILGAKEATPLLEQIQDVYDKAHLKDKKLKSLGYKVCDENGVFTDNGKFYCFNFKTKTKFNDGKTKNIAIYNSKVKKVDLGDTRIGNGSIGAISGNMKYYINGREDGVSLFLSAVQIIKLEQYSEDVDFIPQAEGFEGITDLDTGFTIPETEKKAKQIKTRL